MRSEKRSLATAEEGGWSRGPSCFVSRIENTSDRQRNATRTKNLMKPRWYSAELAARQEHSGKRETQSEVVLWGLRTRAKEVVRAGMKLLDVLEVPRRRTGEVPGTRPTSQQPRSPVRDESLQPQGSLRSNREEPRSRYTQTRTKSSEE